MHEERPFPIPSFLGFRSWLSRGRNPKEILEERTSKALQHDEQTAIGWIESRASNQKETQINVRKSCIKYQASLGRQVHIKPRKTL